VSPVGEAAARPGRAAMFEQLVADGFTHMFGNPGTVEQGFLDRLGSVSEMQYVLALQESVAVGMADGYARASGRAALVQLHSGVGLGNGVGMLYQAMRGHSPLVVVAGEAGVAYEAFDAQMAVDLVAMARPVTKYATRVTHPASLLRVLRRAVKTALTPPRGPVFVALPMDVLDADTAEPALKTVVPSTAVAPTDEAAARVARLLAGASNPLILVGDGVADSGAQDVLARVAELLGAPVWDVNSSTVNMDFAHPLYRGQLGHMFGSVSAAAVAEADAVLIVGTYVFPEVFPRLASPFRPGATVVHIDLDSYEIAKNHPVTIGLVADPALALGKIAAVLSGVVAAEWRGLRRRPAPVNGVAQAPARPDGDEPLATVFARELGRQAAAPLVVFDEALTASPRLLAGLPAPRPGDYHLTRGGSLGIGIPGAIGAKIARPEATVVGFTGDGGSMYTIQALWTAARHGVAAKFVVCNNRRYRLLDDNIARYWDERGIAPHAAPEGFDLSRPELGFTDLARGLGVRGRRVDKPGDAADAVAEMLAHPGPYLVDLDTA
jgi:benzoylformate decarboxylase